MVLAICSGSGSN